MTAGNPPRAGVDGSTPPLNHSVAVLAGVGLAVLALMLVMLAGSMWTEIARSFSFDILFNRNLDFDIGERSPHWHEYLRAILYTVGAIIAPVASGLLVWDLRRQAARFEAVTVGLVMVVFFGIAVLSAVARFA